jgi:hypothetical protein
MSKRLLYVVVTVVFLSLALGVLARSARVRAGPPAQGTETPTVPLHPQNNESDASDIALAPQAGVEPAATASVPPGTSYHVLPPAAFTLDGASPAGYFMDFAGGYVHVPSGSAGLLAPVYLPRGVTVVSLEVFVQDNHATGYTSFYLRRIPLASGSAQAMAIVSSPLGISPDRGPLVDTSIEHPEVSHDYAYQVTTVLNHDTYLYGVRIGYVSTAYLPTVLREHGP